MKEEFDDRKVICNIISEMLDNPDNCGIYPTTRCYDKLEQYIKNIRGEKCLMVKFKKLRKNAITPSYVYDGDAGFDFFAIESGEIFPQTTKTISTGIAWEPKVDNQKNKVFLKIEGRSGLASNGIDVFGGIVDEKFRGEIKVILYNSNDRVWKYKVGDKIAQGIVYKIPIVEIIEVENLSETERGNKGFGSSDKI